MNYTQEQYETLYYLNKLLPRLKTMKNFERDLILAAQKIKEDLVPGLKKLDAFGNSSKIRKVLAEIEQVLAKYGENYPKITPTPAKKNMEYLVHIFRLSKEERAVVYFLSAMQNNELLQECVREFSGDLEEEEDTLTMVAGLPKGLGNSLLNQDAPLMRLGILFRTRYRGNLNLSSWVQEFICSLHKNDAARYEALIGVPVPSKDELTAKDFAYVEAAKLATRLMKQARHTKGFNILLYGTPGTGKSSFAQVLAQSAKLNLYPVGVCNNGEEEKNYRLQQLYRKQFLLKTVKNTCLLLDEGEDIFSSLETRTSKVEINNLLENNEVPVIWTTNKIHRMDPAYIRRFTLAVCFDKPPVEMRQKIWNKYLSANKITYTKGDTLALAKKYEVQPSMIAGAAQAARMAKGGLPTVQEHLSFMMQALNGGRKNPEEEKTNIRFYPALIHADMDLQALTTQLTRLGRLNFSLCLYGASGTGKSAYARYLADKLGLEVVQRRASDLISCYVGETEQNIAKAFAQAREDKSLLIFDEADSFLRDRSTAARSWEVSSVNEMLTWMESHPYPFICTTNLMESLDPASLRRF
ncbi:MAG: AAA family ATPase, partial [Spirochaetota bacterium]|uniref:AAA family ATPase n=1 Tax=Candidatus Avelusimicrobium faecicola TaxID=3416205 RepID=UPI002A5D0DA0|nr:AAA family ATPase [Spirochaetota bacterium]